MFFDTYGLAFSTRSALAADSYQDGIDRYLSFNAGAAACFERAIAADERFALAHAALALAAPAEGLSAPRAATSIGRARALAADLPWRERGHVEAVAAIVAGDAPRALELIGRQLDLYPRDALLLRHAATLIASSGRPDWRETLSDLYAGLRDDYGDDWWFAGAYAMALQECGELDEARRLAEHSLAEAPRNASAAHALAHVLHETGDDAGVRRFLTGWLAGYERAAPFFGHLSWHLALAELADGLVRESLDRYARDIAPLLRVRPAAALADAASLLWRHHLHGDGDHLPWMDVGTAAKAVTSQPGSPHFSICTRHWRWRRRARRTPLQR